MPTKTEADEPLFWPPDFPGPFSTLGTLEQFLEDMKALPNTEQTRDWVRNAEQMLAWRRVMSLKEGSTNVETGG